MFFRVKGTAGRQYLQIAESFREGTRVRQLRRNYGQARKVKKEYVRGWLFVEVYYWPNIFFI